MGRPAPGPDTGETAPGLKERETPETGDRRTLPIGGGRGSKIVFVDFGRNKVYALEDDGDEVMVFDDFAEMVEKLKPSVVLQTITHGSSYLYSLTWLKTG
jgi:hypothetical protein